MPVEQLPHYIIQEKLEMEKVKRETEDVIVKQLQVLQHYNVTMNDLEDYKRNIPLIDYIKQLNDKLEVKREKKYLVKELARKEFEIFTLEYKLMISQQEMDR